ncbi:MAG: ATPase with chaperone activity [Rubrivivax sp.]|nr:ATPase with chaperone activity [Rubrivivax sp.]MDP3613921.1 ATPase with chaperone activity [Rubrivivax sp.]
MSDESQIVVPPSFIALFVPPGRIKPTASRAEIAARYEFCEDLAQMLTEQALDKRWQLGVTEDDVLQRMLGGLQAEVSVVNDAEAVWVVTRLAELLDWPALPPAPPLPHTPAAG